MTKSVRHGGLTAQGRSLAASGTARASRRGVRLHGVEEEVIVRIELEEQVGEVDEHQDDGTSATELEKNRDFRAIGELVFQIQMLKFGVRE